MQSLTQPTSLLKPFAESGDKNTLPVTNTDASNPQLADLTNGFPEVTGEDPDDGGLPPERKDINGLGYLTTTYDYFYQAGGTFTFNTTISTAIGGYPLGARLWYTNGNGETSVLRSTVGNNTDNFNDGSETGIGTTWVKDTPTFSDINHILEELYPVGSLYIGTQSTCPLSTLINGSTWEIVATDKALWGGNGSNGNTTIDAGLPNITGAVGGVDRVGGGQSGAFYLGSNNASGATTSNNVPNIEFDASRSNAIYGNSTTVQPPAYRVNVWRRTA